MNQKNRKKTQPSKTKQSNKEYLFVLDQFTHADVKQWGEFDELLQKYHFELFYCLEAQRVAHQEEIKNALLKASHTSIKIDDWSRIVDYKYCLSPLSSKGSISDIGGRFNIGNAINPIQFKSFNGLYLAERHEAAWREKFGMPEQDISHGLTSNDFALSEHSSITKVSLKGEIQNIFDLRTTKGILPFMEVIAKFRINETVRSLEKELDGIEPVRIIQKAKMLLKHFLETNWRVLPQQFGVPANSQVFGKLIYDCGFEGIVYPSTRGPGDCLVIFPKNLQNSSSYIEIATDYPHGVGFPRLDAKTYLNLL